MTITQNGDKILYADNMFRTWTVSITSSGSGNLQGQALPDVTVSSETDGFVRCYCLEKTQRTRGTISCYISSPPRNMRSSLKASMVASELALAISEIRVGCTSGRRNMDGGWSLSFLLSSSYADTKQMGLGILSLPIRPIVVLTTA